MKLLTMLIVLFVTGCSGANMTMGEGGGFYAGASIIGGLMVFISSIRMTFAGFKDESLKFFIVGTVIFLIG